MKNSLYQNIKDVLEKARSNAYRAVNFAMVEAYWNVGRLIVEEEQRGKKRAQYGAKLIKNLAERLMKGMGPGFTEQNLRNFRQFFLTFQQQGKICYALRSELTWTHYRLLMRIENPRARDYYMNESVDSRWSARALERQIHSHYYERLLSSKNKAVIKKEAALNTAKLPANPGDFIKDPYVLEFLDLKPDASYREKDIEQALIGKLQKFLLELGKGFSFVARQQRVSTETKEFYIDLVFYNYILKCFVLIDLKVGELTHHDIGQMDLYVRLFEDKIKKNDDNPTIGIILCSEKDDTIVKYSVLKGSKKLFASKYKLYLPTEQELIKELEREKQILKLEQKKSNVLRE